jgi:hypothetical protein
MGVDRSDYIIYGWKLPYEIKDRDGNEIDIYDDKYESYINDIEKGMYTIISDGMCGTYRVFGILLEQDTDTWEGWDFVKLSTNKYPMEEVKEKYRELFSNDPPSDPEVFIFSHFW